MLQKDFFLAEGAPVYAEDLHVCPLTGFSRPQTNSAKPKSPYPLLPGQRREEKRVGG